MYCEEKNRCLLPFNNNGKNTSNANGGSNNTTLLSRQANEPPQKNNYSNFFHRFLEPNIGAAIIGIFGSLILHHLNYINHQQDLVTKYIESVQVLLLDEHHESKIKKDPEITPEHIELFIKSKASTTIKHIKNEQARSSLISFLRTSGIGFLPRDGEKPNNFHVDKKPYSDLIKRIDLAHATLNDSDLAYIVLENTNLTGIRLVETGLSKANLDGSKLREADLRGANLIGAYLEGATLIDAKLQKSPLRLSFSGTWPLIEISGNKKTNLFDANLTEANLQRANLTKANLQGANLTEANLQGANLTEANLTEVKFTPAQIKSACNWQQAIYQANWDKEKQKYIPAEPDNTNYIQKLNNNNSSPQTIPDCSKWN